jgi:glutamate dehydrogenase
VLLGYAKISGQQLLLETDFPDRPAARPFLEGYFPRLLRERFSEHFEGHVLRREIVAMVAINYMVNRGGVNLLPHLTRGAEVGIGDAVAAWVDVDRDSEAPALRQALRAARRPAAEEQEALLEVEDALEAAARDRLDGGTGGGAAATVRDVRERLGL